MLIFGFKELRKAWFSSNNGKLHSSKNLLQIITQMKRSNHIQLSKRMREPCPSTAFGWDFNSLKVFQSDNLMYICPENSTIHPYFLQNDSQFLGGEF